MATEKYNVEANLELGGQKVTKSLDGIVKKLQGLQGQVRKINIGFDGMVGKALAFGAAYFSFQAATRGVVGFARSVIGASSEAEALQASLATVYSAVEKVSFSQATEDAKILFRTMEKVAITSTATTTELMGVFQGIYGPLRNAGLTIQQIVDTTNNAAVAAAALGVDFQQASRDISAMARGTAGLDVKTFSLLQSMGLIKETTEEWNKLAPDKRAKKLMDVMGKIGGQAAEAYGRTWKGLSSTFVDIMGAFKRAFGTAVFERLKGTLEKVNKYLLENRERIEAYLRVVGEKVGAAFDHVVNNAGDVFHRVVDNIDTVRARVSELYDKFLEIKPMLASAAKFGVGIQVAATAFNLAAPVISLLVGGVAKLAGIISAIASSGGIGAMLSSMGAGLSSFGAAISAAAVPLAAIVAVVAALVLGFLRFKDVIMRMLQPLLGSFKSIGGQLWKIFKDLYAAVKPLLEIVGGALIISLIMGLRMLAWVIDNVLLPPIRWLAAALRWVVEEILVPLFNLLEPVVQASIDLFEGLADIVNSLAETIGDAIQWIADKINSVKEFFSGDEETANNFNRMMMGGRFGGVAGMGVGMERRDPVLGKLLEEARATAAITGALREGARIQQKVADDVSRAQRLRREKEVLAGERPVTHNDFRGSKITVKQEFREADPDNVWVQFRDGLEKEAVARTRSGFADALAR